MGVSSESDKCFCKSIKVHRKSGFRSQNEPYIILKGRYLEKFGFFLGAKLNVVISNEKIIITKE